MTLQGKRVLIARPRAQAETLARALEAVGAVPVLVPAVAIRPPESWEAVDAVLSQIDQFDWLAFTSANGVRCFFDRLRARKIELAAVRVAVVGPATATALREYGVEPALMPSTHRAEDLAELLQPEVQGLHVLLARADRGRDVLHERLRHVARVEQVVVYRQVDCVEPESLRGLDVDFLLLTSSNIARALLTNLDEAERRRVREARTKIVTISPLTSVTVREMGFPVAGEARVATVAGLIAALANVAEGVPGKIQEHAAAQHGDDIDGAAQSAKGKVQDEVEEE